MEIDVTNGKDPEELEREASDRSSNTPQVKLPLITSAMANAAAAAAANGGHDKLSRDRRSTEMSGAGGPPPPQQPQGEADQERGLGPRLSRYGGRRQLDAALETVEEGRDQVDSPAEVNVDRLVGLDGVEPDPQNSLHQAGRWSAPSDDEYQVVGQTGGQTVGRSSDQGVDQAGSQVQGVENMASAMGPGSPLSLLEMDILTGRSE